MAKEEKSEKASKILREFSSGGVVFKKKDNKVLWLASKTSSSDKYSHTWWRLPKGWIDDSVTQGLPGPISRGEIKATEDDLRQTALREVAEEGGVEARIIKKIGTESFVFYSKERNGKVLKFVTFYLMEFIAETLKGTDFETSQIKWLEYDAARKILSHSGEKKILDKAKEMLDSGI